LVAAVAGLLMGWRVASMTETDVIEAAADRYVSDHDGRREDCAAQPGTPPVWITVVCTRNGRGAIYQFDNLGRMKEIAPADPADAAREL